MIFQPPPDGDNLTRMRDVAQLLLLVALSGAAVTCAGAGVIWLRDDLRRIRSALSRVLGGDPEIMLIARGRGRGVGLSLAERKCVVAWDGGAWCMIYRLDEIMGVELIIDGQIVGRTFRGEPRRALDQVVTQASRVTLRMIFDDPHHPDFDLDLWQTGDERRRLTRSPADAVTEANRWLARVEAILRRPQASRADMAATVALPPKRAGAPPPWEMDEEIQDEEEVG